MPRFAALQQRANLAVMRALPNASASWLPPGGDAAVERDVLFDEAAEVEEQGVVTLAPVAVVALSDFPGIGEGHQLTINGNQYRARQRLILDSGGLARLILTRST